MKLVPFDKNPEITIVYPEATPEYVATVPFKIAPNVWWQNKLGIKPEVEKWKAYVFLRSNSSLYRIAKLEEANALILLADPSQSRMSKADTERAVEISWSIGEHIFKYLANNDGAFNSLVCT